MAGARRSAGINEPAGENSADRTMHRENPEANSSDNGPASAGILVFSIDDISRDLMSRVLHNAGYRVSVAADLAAAQRLLAERSFDLVLVDRWVPCADARILVGGIRENAGGMDSPAILVISEEDQLLAAGPLVPSIAASVIRPCGINTLIAHVGDQLTRRGAAAGRPARAARDADRRSAGSDGHVADVEIPGRVYADALAAVDEGFVVWDSEDRLVACNESYRRRFGPVAEFVVRGARFEDLMRRQLESGVLRVGTSRHHDWLAQRLAAHRSCDGPWEDEYSDGTWVKVTETRTATGATVGLCTDVSHIRRRELALKTFAENNRRLAAAVNATTSAILITDPKRPGNPTVFANPAFSTMTGWPVEEALGRDRSFLNGSETDLDAVARFEQDMADGRPAAAELRLQARGGRPIEVALNASPIRSAEGGVANWVIVQTDVTARNRADAAVLEPPDRERIDPSTGGHLHDLNNLLTVARGNLESAVDGAEESDSESRTTLDSALEAINRASDVARLMLGRPARSMPAPVPVDLGDTLQAFRSFFGRSLDSRHRVLAATGKEIWPVLVDQRQMENAILNLALNAREAMPDGGTVTLEAVNTTVKGGTDVCGQPVADGDYVCISVQDDGAGMSREVIARAVEPFFTTKSPRKGSGLGLSTVRDFVTRSGGFMAITSQPGSGTTVCLFLPRTPDRVQSGATVRKIAYAGGTETLLVVDDEACVRAVVALHLARLGYQILQAGSAEEALNFLHRGHRVDLLITDVGLSGGMDGYQLVAAVRARRPDARAIVMSGSCDRPVPDVARILPGVRYLTKPYHRAVLADLVRSVLDSDHAAAWFRAAPATPA